MRIIAVLIALLTASPAWAQFTPGIGMQGPTSAGHTAVFVQTGAGSAFSGTTVSHTLTGVVAGHLILVMVCANPNTITLSGITVGGNAATLFSASTGAAGTYNCRGGFYANPSGGSNAVVGTVSSACTGCNILTEEWSGLTTSASVEGNNATYTADGTAGTNLPAGSFTTTTNGDMIWVALYQPQNAAPTNPGGYTTGTSVAPWYSAFLSPQATAGSTNPTFVSTTGSTNNMVVGAGIKP